MADQDLANFATDLRRISLWIYYQNYDLANRFLDRSRKTYTLPPSVGPYPDIWHEVALIRSLSGGRLQASERALTLSSILLHESRKA